jgi:hypothetical protein
MVDDRRMGGATMIVQCGLGGAALLAVAALVSADAVRTSDQAIAIGIKSCGSLLGTPLADHPKWKAKRTGDHWDVGLFTDFSRRQHCGAVEVSIAAADGSASPCSVCIPGNDRLRNSN